MSNYLVQIIQGVDFAVIHTYTFGSLDKTLPLKVSELSHHLRIFLTPDSIRLTTVYTTDKKVIEQSRVPTLKLKDLI